MHHLLRPLEEVSLLLEPEEAVSLLPEPSLLDEPLAELEEDEPWRCLLPFLTTPFCLASCSLHKVNPCISPAQKRMQAGAI